MADYYVKGSVLLTLPKPILESITKILDEANDGDENGIDMGVSKTLEADYCNGQQYEWQEEGTALWVYDDINFNPSLLGDAIHYALKEHNSDVIVGFEWALDCSKPRVDGYGGGACVVSRLACKYLSTFEWTGREAETQEEALRSAVPTP